MGKHAVVVGATGNLGKAVCVALENAGFTIDPVWRGEDHPDATLAASYDSLPDKIDLAVYLAGVNAVEDTQNLPEEIWDRVVDTNLKGAFLFAKAAYPKMVAAGSATFIGISSINALHPYPKRAAYAASKAGLEGLIRELAVEWGEVGIATHAIRLGHLEGLMKSTKANPALLDAVRARTPSHTLVPPEAVGEYIAWIGNSRARYLSGSVIDFDPAYTLNRWPL
ncbi:MAG: SDR family oxidoreductase [Rectinemataceae bacterium]|nr:SDR family oxidoreductase [Rectinemataceae bacterium]